MGGYIRFIDGLVYFGMRISQPARSSAGAIKSDKQAAHARRLATRHEQLVPQDRILGRKPRVGSTGEIKMPRIDQRSPITRSWPTSRRDGPDV